MKQSIKRSLTQKAMQALSDAVAKVVEDHQRRGRPLVVCETVCRRCLPHPPVVPPFRIDNLIAS